MEKNHGFRFEIGSWLEMKKEPNHKVYVLERRLIECLGGIQREYLCRLYGKGSGMERWIMAVTVPVIFREHELSPLDDTP